MKSLYSLDITPMRSMSSSYLRSRHFTVIVFEIDPVGRSDSLLQNQQGDAGAFSHQPVARDPLRLSVLCDVCPQGRQSFLSHRQLPSRGLERQSRQGCVFARHRREGSDRGRRSNSRRDRRSYSSITASWLRFPSTRSRLPGSRSTVSSKPPSLRRLCASTTIRWIRSMLIAIHRPRTRRGF